MCFIFPYDSCADLKPSRFLRPYTWDYFPHVLIFYGLISAKSLQYIIMYTLSPGIKND